MGESGNNNKEKKSRKMISDTGICYMQVKQGNVLWCDWVRVVPTSSEGSLWPDQGGNIWTKSYVAM